MSVEDVAGESDFNSLTQWLMANTKDKELTVLMAQLALACKATSRACAKAGIANLFGMAGDQNSSGDDQKKLDVLSNDIFINALVKSGSCAVLVSEENDEVSRQRPRCPLARWVPRSLHCSRGQAHKHQLERATARVVRRLAMMTHASH